VLARIKTGSKVDIEARLSESPAVRRELSEQIRAALQQAGGRVSGAAVPVHSPHSR
jgi:hypothetical protein